MAGLTDKYLVYHKHDVEGKHDDCEYFVLDPQHDPLAASAIAYYSVLADLQPDLGELAEDLIQMLMRAKAKREAEDGD